MICRNGGGRTEKQNCFNLLDLVTWRRHKDIEVPIICFADDHPTTVI